MRAPVHLELFIWVTRWYGLSIPAKLVQICTRDQMQKDSVSQDKSPLVTTIPDTLIGISHWDIATFCIQKILSFIMHIPSRTNTATTDVPWQLSSLSFSPDATPSNEKQALGEKFAWKVITWKSVSIPEKHSGSVSQQNCLQALKKRHSVLLRPHSLATASQSHREAVASQDLDGFLFPARRYAGDQDWQGISGATIH